MSLTTLLFAINIANASPNGTADFDHLKNDCTSYVQRTAPQIIAEYQSGQLNFDCTEIVKINDQKLSPYSQERNFSSSDLSGASFRGSKLENTNWDMAQLLATDFSYADLSNSILRVNAGPNHLAENSKFIGITGRCATFSGNFSYANFTDANLTCNQTGFYTNIVEANFSYANFTRTDFSSNTFFPDPSNLLCVVMPYSDLAALKQEGYEAQAPKVRAGQNLCD